MNKSLAAKILACVSVVLVLSFMAACTVTVETVKGNAVVYNNAYSPSNEYWLIEVELWEKNVSASDKKIAGRTWDHTDEGFYLELDEGLKFENLVLYKDYYIKAKDIDYNSAITSNPDVRNLESKVFYATNADVIYIAYNRTVSGLTSSFTLDVSTSKPTNNIEFPYANLSVGVVIDKTSVVVKAAKDRKAPPAINGLDVTVTEGAER